MAEVSISPASRIDGDMDVPGDKSISHRALILGALARGRSYVGNLSPAADVQATLRCLRDCGVFIRDAGRGRVAVEGAGPGRSLRTPGAALDCANSGTTMRLLAGALAGHDCSARLDGDASLRRRPMERVAEPLRAMGATVTTTDGGAPLQVQGAVTLRAIDWETPVASAQVKSAILLAALSGDGPTRVREPQPTRDHTERLLRLCGVETTAEGGCVTLTPSVPNPFGLRVPGDISGAAFFLALAAARRGWRVRVTGVGLNPGRTGILDVLRLMGADVDVDMNREDGGEPMGDVSVRGGALRSATIGGQLLVRCIDEVPVIAVLATQAEGVTEIRDAAELRRKESDRIAAVVDGLRAFGAECESTADGLVVTGPTALRAARIDALGDHRLAMAWAIAASLADAAHGPSTIVGADAAGVSYPSFFEELGRLVSG